jgi:WhiB family redox-sensing transcriptional regulator
MRSVKAPGSDIATERARSADEESWTARAACRRADPELFFPIGSSGPAALKQIAAAKEICARCPVREQCLRFALGTGQDYGIWGGLTADERRRMRRREPAAALRPAPGPRHGHARSEEGAVC